MRIKAAGLSPNINKQRERDILDVYSKQEVDAGNQGLSVRPTISSDFEKNEHKLYEQYGLEPKTITQMYDVVRASTATYVDATGKIRTAGVNEPRIDYSSGQGRLLVEEQRTNVLLHSDNLASASWDKSGTTGVSIVERSPIVIGSPVHQVNMDNDVAFPLRQNLNVGVIPAGTVYSSRVYLKAVDSSDVGKNIVVQLRRGLGDFERSQITHTLTNYWTPVDVIHIFQNEPTDLNFELVPAESNTTDKFLYQAGQVEVGSTPSSYIPTEASAVTRAADNVSRVLGDEFNTSGEGAVYFEVDKWPAAGSSKRFMSIGVLDSFLDRIVVRGAGTSWLIQDSGSSPSPAFIEGQPYKVLYKWDGLSFKAFANGLKVMDITLISPFINATNIQFNRGQGVQQTPPSLAVGGYRYYPKSLSDQECIELTKV